MARGLAADKEEKKKKKKKGKDKGGGEEGSEETMPGEKTEAAGWDGFFVWDHIVYTATVTPSSPTPVVAMAAIAAATERVRIGAAGHADAAPDGCTSSPARETATLDRLSGGRSCSASEIGGDRGTASSRRSATRSDPRERARRLDADLERLVRVWGGEFQPRAGAGAADPGWVAARWPNPAALRAGALGRRLPDRPARAGGAGRAVGEVRAERDGARSSSWSTRTPRARTSGPWEAAGRRGA